MTIKEVYKRFPTEHSCYKHLEKIIWDNKPFCPYCKSIAKTDMPKENRYRCNTCNTSYSVTVGTLFHRTRLALQKWFYAIYLVLNSDEDYGIRQLGRELEITKDTASLILKKIKQAFINNPELLKKIINDDK